MERSNFVTINADRMYEVDKLTGTEYAIFNFIIRKMDSENYFYLMYSQKRKFTEKLGISVQTYNNNFSKLAKAGLIKLLGCGECVVNKDYASKTKAMQKVAYVKPVVDAWKEANGRNGHVYLLSNGGAFGESVFYVGKSYDLKSRLASHEHREVGSKAFCIEFHSRAEADYAENVLINFLMPRKNLKRYNHLKNDTYAEILLSRNWGLAKEYNTTGKVETVEIK